VGNRLSQTVGGVTTNYTYDIANRLLFVNGANVTHDANGQLTAFGSESYTWDVRGRLSGLTKPGLTATYGYDPSGLRTRQTVNGTTTTFLLDGGSVVSESTGGVAKHTLQGPFLDQPLAREGKYFTPNHLGSTTTLTDGSGNTVQQYSYQPFGQGTESPSPGDSNPFRFAGREDDETGLHYNRARYYRPEWGRFISEDPLGSGGASQYAYAANNPINLADPWGLQVSRIGPVCVEPDPTGGSISYPCTPDLVRTGPNLGPQETWWGETSSSGSGIGNVVNLDNATNFVAGWGDTLSGGGTEYVRDWLGVNDYVNTSSGYYFAGEVVGDIHGRLLRRPSGGLSPLASYASDITRNKQAGDALRDSIADALRSAGRGVEIEVPKKTRFGMRYIDIEVYDQPGGQLLGGIEVKKGGSRYHTLQRRKDVWLGAVYGYI
jgi:RHS repeat-associated protein